MIIHVDGSIAILDIYHQAKTASQQTAVRAAPVKTMATVYLATMVTSTVSVRRDLLAMSVTS